MDTLSHSSEEMLYVIIYIWMMNHHQDTDAVVLL